MKNSTQVIKNIRLADSRYWVINVFFNIIMHILPRNKKTWVFGAWVGEKYSDNSKYLYEYVKSNHPNIDAYWITKNYDLYVRKSRIDPNFLYYKTKKALGVLLKAGVVFFTNGLDDYDNFSLSGGAYRVNLNHGAIMKRVCLASNEHMRRKTIYKILGNIKRKLFWSLNADLMPITSKNLQNYYVEAFGIKESRIVVTGQPRNDVFFNNTEYNIYKSIYNCGKIILFMPTHRTDAVSNKLLEELINEFSIHEGLKCYLENNNCKFLIKTHFLQNNEGHSNNSHVIFVDDKEIEDVQMLLKCSDILVTDFSSCFIDFSLLDRPILFLAKDKKEYLEGDYGANVNMFEFAKDISFENLDDFVKALYLIDEKKLDWEKSQIKIKNFFNDRFTNFYSYSENVYNEVLKRINMVKN